LSVDLFVSRHVTFYSVVLAGAGCYLLAMTAVAYGIRLIGGAWGAALQGIFLFAALVLLGLVVLSGTMRSQLKVFIAKHFYSNRFDYRDEWLRLTATLGEAGEPLGRRAIHALAQIVDAAGGVLWLRRDPAGGNSAWEKAATWRSGGGPERLLPGDSLLDFVCHTNWSVDAKGVVRNPAAYDGLVLPEWMRDFGPRALAVPLLGDNGLYGLVVLRDVRAGLQLSYEEIDLLRVAGRQAAVALAQAEADQLLTESRQFEAFNRLTAFLMHDLKNLIAQQSLVVHNAARFRHDPKFIDDAIETIDNSVRRMQRLLEQLRRSSERHRAECVDLASLLRALVSEHGSRAPVPTLEVGSGGSARVQAEPDGLHLIIGHVIRNAQDATAADGSVTVSLEADAGQAVIVVADTGSGMEPAFVRHRLFRPFDSTKGPKGMGIGAYQVRQFVEDAGGRVSVESAPGAGTRFEIRLPLVEMPRGEPTASPAPLNGTEQLASG
jgi:putative PEP-CTERM system histidine kinase